MIVASFQTLFPQDSASREPFGAALAWIALVFLAGRIVLAWLPRGHVGGHAPRDLATTAAASLFLGLVIGIVIDAAPSRFRLGCWIAIGLLGLARLATAPAAMVPRHEPPLAPPSWLAHVLRLTGWILIGLACRTFLRAQSTESPLPPAVFVACAFAAAFLLDHALEVARCAPWVRGAGVVTFASLLHLEPILPGPGFAPILPFLFAAAASSSVAWLRRGDKRALALSAAFFAGTWALDRGAWPLAVAGAAWLVAGSPPPSRLPALSFCAAALAVAFATQGHLTRESQSAPVMNPSLSGIVGVLFVLIVAARWKDMQLLRARAWNPSGARRGHEDTVLLRAVITALLLTMAVDTFAPHMQITDPIRPALLVLALLAGMSLQRFAPTARAVA
jgi:hypothetical protein